MSNAILKKNTYIQQEDQKKTDIEMMEMQVTGDSLKHKDKKGSRKYQNLEEMGSSDYSLSQNAPSTQIEDDDEPFEEDKEDVIHT